MIGRWLRKRRRQKILAEPMPAEHRRFIAHNVKGFANLSPKQQARLEDDARVFVSEVSWDGGNGVQITDEVKLTIAAQACQMLLGFDEQHAGFADVREVVVLETTYDWEIGRDRETQRPSVLGHTYYYGPVYLAWDAVRHGGQDPRDGRNLVYHEFAHKLDLSDGLADGTPDLAGRVKLQTWVDVMTAAYDERCDRADAGRATLLDQYGTENPAEFFAVATECFFERGDALRDRHPELYDVLRRYYRQDPAARVG